MSDARRCSVCDMPGTVYLDREPADGPTIDPVVECPVCAQTWVANGVQHAWKVGPDTTIEELEAIVELMRESM